MIYYTRFFRPMQGGEKVLVPPSPLVFPAFPRILREAPAFARVFPFPFVSRGTFQDAENETPG